jgi:hypothetical protein
VVAVLVADRQRTSRSTRRWPHYGFSGLNVSPAAAAGELVRSRMERRTVADDWRQYFPAGSLDTRPDLHRCRAEWYTDARVRLGEGPLHPAGPDQPFVVRLLCLPTWAPACSVRGERSGLVWRLLSRELDGEESGFDLGELAHRDDRLIVGADADRLTALWAWLRFWSIPTSGGEDVLDGTAYVLEAAERGRYRVVVRDDPEWGDTFGELADLLIGFAGLTPR